MSDSVGVGVGVGTSGLLREAWSAIKERSLAWAFRARDRLAQSLDPDIREHLLAGETEVYVVVFGKTQVGKTTLLLELMDVHPEMLPRVSTALRGGRAHGRSATATAMEYGRSPDSLWRLREGGGEVVAHDDTSIREALAGVRERTIQEGIDIGHPVRVSIPTDCFLQPGSGAARVNVRMLDLPGDHASDERERHHVFRVAERLVPGADLVLLVGKVNDLSFVRPGALNLPRIADWQIIPDRFRIVTTYSFTAKSMQDHVRRDPAMDIRGVRERLRRELSTFVKLDGPAFAADRLFPLEIGDSMASLKATDPPLALRVQGIVDGLKDELAETIRTATTPLARLRAALDIHLIVARVKKARLTELKTERDALAGQVGKACADVVAVHKKQLDRLAEDRRMAAIERSLDRCLRRVDATARARFDAETWLRSVLRPAQSVKALQDFAAEFRLAARACSRPIHVEADSADPDAPGEVLVEMNHLVAPGVVEEVLDQSLGEVEERLDGYWMDGYFSSDSFAHDHQELVKVMRLAAQILGERACHRLRGAFAVRREGIARDAKAVRQDHIRGDHIEIKLKQKLRTRERSLEDKDELIARTEAQMAAGQRLCEQFSTLLDEEYLIALREARARVEAGPPAFAFVELIAAYAMRQARSTLLRQGRPAAATTGLPSTTTSYCP